VKHLLNALLRVGRAKLVDDTGPVQRVQVDEGDLGSYGGRRVIDKVAHVMQFGFSSAPPEDAELLLGAPGGDRAQTIAFGSNHQASRPRNLKPGDSCQYDVRGQVVKMTAEGLMIDCAGLPAIIRNFASLTVQGDIHVTGDVISRSSGSPVSLNGLRDAYVEHVHPVTAINSPTGKTDHPA
jgi:phage gp45-like